MFVEAPVLSHRLVLRRHGRPGLQHGPGHASSMPSRARNQNWSQPRCQWDVGSQHRTQDEVDALVQFFHAVAQGMTHSFRFRDFTDDTFDNPIGTGDGTTTTFQLVKVYTYGAQIRRAPLSSRWRGACICSWLVWRGRTIRQTLRPGW